jgi:hypothetical protein
MVPQIRESAYHVSTYDYDWLIGALGTEKQRFEEKDDFCPPPYVLVRRRSVMFDNRVDVFEVDKIDERHKDSLWFTEEELDGFAQRSDEREFKKRSSQQLDARAYNHSRRVLLHYKVCMEMGDSKGLDYISRQSSKKCKALSRQNAIRVEKAVKKYKTESGLKSSSFQKGLDYYMNRLYDLLPSAQ